MVIINTSVVYNVLLICAPSRRENRCCYAEDKVIYGFPTQLFTQSVAGSQDRIYCVPSICWSSPALRILVGGNVFSHFYAMFCLSETNGRKKPRLHNVFCSKKNGKPNCQLSGNWLSLTCIQRNLEMEILLSVNVEHNPLLCLEMNLG